MGLVGRGRLSAVAAAVMLLAVGGGAVSCGQQDAAGPGDVLPVGWTELRPAPYPDELRPAGTFWGGADVIVFGGSSLSGSTSGGSQLEFAVSETTYAYSVQSGLWRKAGDLQVPGYDGIGAAAGGWTGRAWVGLGRPCRSGPSSSEVLTDYNCAETVVGLLWTPEAGWSVSGPQGEAPIARYAGMTADSVVVVSGSTMFTHPRDSTDPGGWSVYELPPEAAPGGQPPPCVVGDSVLTVQWAGPNGEAVDSPALPQVVSVSVIDLTDLSLTRRPLTDLITPMSGVYAFCRENASLLVAAGFESPLQVVTPDTTVDLPTSTSMDQGPLFVAPPAASEMVDVGAGLLQLGSPTVLLDPETGALLALADAPSLTAMWTGEILIGTTFSAGNRWFAFRPEATWEASADLLFPLPLPLPVP